MSHFSRLLPLALLMSGPAFAGTGDTNGNGLTIDECTAVPDLGSCEMVKGYAPTGGNGCKAVGGCSTKDAHGVDWSAQLYSSLSECVTACGTCDVVDDDLLGGQKVWDYDSSRWIFPYDDCLPGYLGYAWDGSGCSILHGCGTRDLHGVDRSPYIFDTSPECESACRPGSDWEAPERLPKTTLTTRTDDDDNGIPDYLELGASQSPPYDAPMDGMDTNCDGQD